MDFDLSKENIQPLRNGRNVAQLGVALQAQTNEDYQRQLMQQKQYVIDLKIQILLVSHQLQFTMSLPIFDTLQRGRNKQSFILQSC